TLLASPSASNTSERSHVALLATASVVIVAVCWGVYAADVGADLALSVPAATAFMRLPSVASSGAWGGALEVVTAVAITGRLMASVTGAVAVVSLALADPWLSPIAPALSVYPALLAIPLAAGAGWIAAARQR